MSALGTKLTDSYERSTVIANSVLCESTGSRSPGFQLIVTEHANLRDEWFQNALVEDPWTKPPALVPEHWPSEPLN
ncbi:DUF3732 domain-containing protein [Enterobacter ludwigii]